jgi:hypothetical protein
MIAMVATQVYYLVRRNLHLVCFPLMLVGEGWRSIPSLCSSVCTLKGCLFVLRQTLLLHW